MDHPEQYARARTLIADGVFVPLTVVLETAWVLQSRFNFGRVQIAEKLVEVAGLPSVQIEEPQRLALAAGWVRAGMNFADALHLAAAKDGFATFDSGVARIAKREGVTTLNLL